MKTVQLMGGLGNWMFQIAFLEYLNQQGIIAYIDSNLLISPHSSVNYLETVFREWKELCICNPNSKILGEYKNHPHDWIHESKYWMLQPVMFQGYFQTYKFITTEFLSKIYLPTRTLEKYPNIQNSVFLHIRGGDYINHSLLHINLDVYYHRAIQLFPNKTHFAIFTNDIGHAKTKGFLSEIKYTFIEEPELDSLYLMSQCKGGICANSSFSWWGAYLNPNRQLILPSKWFNEFDWCSDGYYFPGCNIVNV